MRDNTIIKFTENLGNIYFSFDELGNLDYLSPCFDQWVGLDSGLSLQDAGGEKVSQITRKFQFDHSPSKASTYTDFIDAEDWRSIKKTFIKILENKVPYEISYQLIGKNRKKTRVIEKGYFIESAPNQIYCVGTIQKVENFKSKSEFRIIEQKLKKFEEQRRTILNTYSKLSIQDDFGDNFNLACKNIYRTSNFNRIIISTFYGETQQREIIGAYGYETEELKQIKGLDLDKNFFEKILEKGTPITSLSYAFPGELSSFLGEHWKTSDEPDNVSDEPIRSPEDIIFVKIIDKAGCLIGMIMAYHPRENFNLSEYITGYLESISTLLSQVITNRQYRLAAEASKAQLAVTNQNLYSVNQQLEKAMFESSEMAQKAHEATRVKSQFLANMSHEIRTPMNAILGFSKLLESTPLSPGQKESLTKIQLSSSSLLRIINDILDFSKIEAGKMELENNRFHLYTITDYISDMFSKKASDKAVELVIAVDQTVPKVLIGDQLRIRQILVNLVNNALKFTPTGNVILGIRVRSLEKKSVDIKFSVTDSGTGIPKDKMRSLFDPFSQVDGSTTRKYGGTGLGLSICYQLVNLMGGNITVDSQPGCGSTFNFNIPIQYDPIKDSKEVVPKAILGYRIAIVDKSPFFTKTMKKYLEYFGFHVKTFRHFSHFHKATQSCSKKLYNLVILDQDSIGNTEQKGDYDIPLLLAKVKLPVLMTTQITHYTHKALSNTPNRIVLHKPIKYSAFLKSILQLLGYGKVDDKKREIVEKINNVKAFLKGINVLLVEDNFINQQVASDILKKVGIHVVVAGNGQEALNILIKEPFDIVLMDVQMPVLNGYEATRNIRKIIGLKELPIIAMTAFAMKGDREKCLASGMNDYITKPIDIDQFYRTLLKWIPYKSIMENHPERQNQEVEDFDTETQELEEQLSAINLKTVLSRFQGNRGLFMKLLREFVTIYGKAAEKISAALAGHNEGEAYKLLHTLKGISGNLSADQLYQSIVNFSKALKDPKIKNYSSYIKSFQSEFNQVITAEKELNFRFLDGRISVSEGEKNKGELSHSLKSFYRLLAENDMEAEQYFYSIKSDLKPLLGPINYKKVEQHINNFEFDDVKLILTSSIPNLDFSF